MGAYSGYGTRQEHAAGWTEHRIKEVTRLWAAGNSGSAIAQEMGGGLTRAAVIAKVHRLKLPPRTCDVKRANHREGVAKRNGKRPAAKPRPEPKPRPIARVPTHTWAPAEPITERDEPRGLCTIVTVGAHMCRWPIGDPQDAGFTLCGKRTERTYCEGHAARAYDARKTAAKRNTADLARSLRRYA